MCMHVCMYVRIKLFLNKYNFIHKNDAFHFTRNVKKYLFFYSVAIEEKHTRKNSNEIFELSHALQ